jgi:hypothetical protein
MNQKILIISKHDSLRIEILNAIAERHARADECIGLVLDRGQNSVFRGYLPDSSLHSFNLQEYGLVIIDPNSLDDNSTPGITIARTFTLAGRLVVWVGIKAPTAEGVVAVNIFDLRNYLKASPELNAYKVKDKNVV